MSSFVPVAVSDQFWVRFKTNGQGSARGFKFHWSREYIVIVKRNRKHAEKMNLHKLGYLSIKQYI